MTPTPDGKLGQRGRLKAAESTVEGDMEIAKTATERLAAYMESDVPKEQASYKIIFVHGFFCCRHDVLNVSQGLLQELGIYLLSFDRPRYYKSDAHPTWMEESIAVDIAELADNLQLGARFHLMGFFMGGEIMWSCLKHIPHRQ
ncbi:hypothetical protein ZWY2020_034117 [Hordeum vulgare]|nr:hypothetical protein ZWY2020_034117 [Hordeum vulgare]